ncbi:hypothetical protein GM418_04035 [Maribellus comscasis]|uniref:Uncharacterized protein n=1 Tax=Maribellus comscasis TaxID=2681766 RepID=A0A6I6JRR7_9BACT|nr:hypothetical protein [Maribellus comscasis]QGY42852.1 hypothetical protein GM418_04035 [Maribellus comscasis]
MKVKIFLFAVIQLSVVHICAQSLEESLGGIETNFQFFSNNIDLKVTDQFIIKRAEKKASASTNYSANSAYGYGYGYQSFHLEFVTKEYYTIEEVEHKGRYSDKIELTFYNSDDIALATHTLDYSVVDLSYNISSDEIQFFYSIDLLGIPIVLLNKTAKINFIKKVSNKK